MDHTNSVPTNQRAGTLIVLHGNRYIEVFASDRHPVKIVNVPDMRSIEGELQIEELLTLRLSPYWRQVYVDGILIDRDRIKNVSSADLSVREVDYAVHLTLDRILSDHAKHEASQWRTVLA